MERRIPSLNEFINEQQINEQSSTVSIQIPEISDVDHTRIIKWMNRRLDSKSYTIEKNGSGYVINTEKLSKREISDLMYYLESHGYLKESVYTEIHEDRNGNVTYTKDPKAYLAYNEAKESVEIHEAKGVPSNIEQFAKEKGCISDVAQIARWVIKATGHGITGGTAIGKYYDTLVLDIKYQDGAIYYETYEGTIKVYGEYVDDWKSFKEAYDKNNK